MNKTAKTAMITALTLCVVGMVLSTAGYFAGGKDFNDSSGHVYVSGGTCPWITRSMEAAIRTSRHLLDITATS